MMNLLNVLNNCLVIKYRDGDRIMYVCDTSLPKLQCNFLFSVSQALESLFWSDFWNLFIFFVLELIF